MELEKREKPHEQVAKEAVLHHVRRLGYAAMAEFVGGNSEAPDYWLTLNGGRHALEVTMVMDSDPLGGDKALTRAGSDAGFARLAANVKRAALAEGILNGFIYLSPPTRYIHGFKKRLPMIVEGVLAFLREGRAATQERHGSVPVDEYGAELLDIYHNPNMRPAVETSCCDADYVGAAEAKLRVLVANRIETKRKCLDEVDAPKILALVHGYPMVEHDAYTRAFEGIHADDFAAIVVVVAHDRVLPLAWRLPAPVVAEGPSAV